MAFLPSAFWLLTRTLESMPAANEAYHRLDASDLSRLSYRTGAACIEIKQNAIRLSLEHDQSGRYSNAQVDDYHLDGLMRWQAPVQMSVRARFSHAEAALGGTAGFGFWNDPFGMTKIGAGLPLIPRFRLPQAVWYFFA